MLAAGNPFYEIVLYRSPFSQCTVYCIVTVTYLVLAGVSLSLPQRGWHIFLCRRVRKYSRIAGSLGRLDCFRSGRERKSSAQRTRHQNIETVTRRVPKHAPCTAVVSAAYAQDGKRISLDACNFIANGSFHLTRVEALLIALADRYQHRRTSARVDLHRDATDK